jgi:hypothetical protein
LIKSIWPWYGYGIKFVRRIKHSDGKNPVFSNNLRLLRILFNPKASMSMINVETKPFQKLLFVKKELEISLN